MSGLYLPHVYALWVQPALAALPASLNTLSAQQGVLGIGNTESAGYRYIKQIGFGPALGFWQMEPATHDDAWANFIHFRPALQTALIGLLGGKGACHSAWQIRHSMRRLCAVCSSTAPPWPYPRLITQRLGLHFGKHITTPIKEPEILFRPRLIFKMLWGLRNGSNTLPCCSVSVCLALFARTMGGGSFGSGVFFSKSLRCYRFFLAAPGSGQ